MSNSGLVDLTMRTDHCYGRDGKKIDKIFIHHMAGNLSVKQCGEVFRRNAVSAHYGVNGRHVGLYVDEKNAAWHCGNRAYNKRSIGIELANDQGASGKWHVSKKTVETCILLVADICRRNGIKKVKYTGDLSGNLCMHCWVVNTACPGPYLKGKMKYIAEQANRLLAAKSKAAKDAEKKESAEVKNSGSVGEKDVGAKSGSAGKKDNGAKNASDGVKSAAAAGERFAVRVKVNDLYIRSGPGTGYEPKGFIRPGVYTITETKGSWGKLLSGKGWICMEYVDRV